MKKILSRVRRAVDDYHMIEEGDRIAVGVSGGKDSLTLLCALAGLRKFYPKSFSLTAVSLDMGFEGMDFSKVEALCKELDVPYVVKKTDIAEIIFDVRQEKNPCSLCAKMRRGSLNTALVEKGIRKIALGHHYDDAVETLLMNLLFEGRIGCFQPVTYLDRMDVLQIRPLLYCHEEEIRRTAAKLELPIIHNPCPADGSSRRQEVKELLVQLEGKYPDLKKKLFGAIQRYPLYGWSLETEER